jgi:hypothetical protein
MKTRLSLFSQLINWSVDLFELIACCVLYYRWPRFISFTESDCVSVARPSISTKGLVRNFSNVRPTHHDPHTCQTNCISHTVGFFGHSGHCADPHQLDLLILHELNDFIVTHWTSISINQDHLVVSWSEGLEQKHPEVWHEVARDAIVWIVEQDFHLSILRD